MLFNSDYVTKKCQLKYIFTIKRQYFPNKVYFDSFQPLNVQYENIIILL